ncbi:hypothetical protein PhaeoP97_00934 [Phaeobacter porticola]|uniref:Uncharacterized protein n=1 Tax=Phaeobacter porticola TaxID=1844006 RepID=A0A1L3I2N2_9RHOB|nr:hypothetical protein PhaeoP97_00934 [Phaeobacter porticola]
MGNHAGGGSAFQIANKGHVFQGVTLDQRDAALGIAVAGELEKRDLGKGTVNGPVTFKTLMW